MAKHHKASIIGHFSFGNAAADGQTVKTRTVYELVSDVFGKDEISAVDTYMWHKHPIRLFAKCFLAAKSAHNVIILPAKNGVKVFVPLLLLFSRLFKCRVIYSVIGGWLPDYLSNKPFLKSMLQQIDCILVETSAMVDDLRLQGFANVTLVRNFKRLPRIARQDANVMDNNPIRLTYFARVEKIKGVEDAVWAVSKANKILGGRYRLDIYGRIPSSYKSDFITCLENACDSLVAYKGCVDPSDSISALKGAAALLFPTRYSGEGVPGSIIDAFCSGVPVISSQWPSYSDVVIEGRNGITYEFENRKKLLDILLQEDLYDQLESMRKFALLSADAYRYETGLEVYKRILIDSDSSGC